MNLKLKGSKLKPKGNIFHGARQSHPRVIPSVVQLKVDPMKDVKVSGEGVKKLNRIDADKKTKYSKFANFNL